MTTFIGRTADEAIEEGLAALHVDRKDVEIKLIQKPRKGFLGFGKRDAKVEMVVISHEPNRNQIKKTAEEKKQARPTVKKDETKVRFQEKDASKPSKKNTDNNEAIEKLKQYLSSIIEQLGIHADLEVTHHSSKSLKINFKTQNEGLLIGKHGLTINALQALSEIYLNRLGVYHLEVELDTANYRQRRMDVLKKLAERTARDVVANGQPVYLDPMPSFERKQIHKTLEHTSHVRTYSAGREPHRAVVVAPR